jgi:hypothetical protein
MNARKNLTLTLVMLLTAVSTAMAAPGTNKARGIYNRGGWESGGSVARSQSSYSYQAPTTYSAPVVQASPAPMVAQAPAEGRRFSYSPSTSAVNSTPCPQGQAHNATVAPPVPSDRRFSYAPSAEVTAPAVPSTGTYNSRPSYSVGGGSRSVDRWALPKTDPRKYNSR